MYKRISIMLMACAGAFQMNHTFAQGTKPVEFRGENHCGIFSAEKGLLKEWPAEGPRKLWVVSDAGKGNSSAVVEGEFIYTSGLTEDEQHEQVTCYDLDGKQVYQKVFGRAWTKSYVETRCTPIIDGDNLFIVSGMGELVCMNKVDGTIRWSLDYWEKYGLTPNDQGICEQPLLDGNHIVVNVSGKDKSLVCLNKKDGSVVWEAPSFGDKTMYVPCKMVEWKGKRQIIAATEEHLFGVDPSDGSMAWNDTAWVAYPEDKKWSNAMVNTPVFYNGFLLVSLGDGHGCTLYKMADDLSGVNFQWKKKDVDFYMGGMIEHEGVVYGSTGNKNLWAALDLKSGEVKYLQAWQGKSRGALIEADGMFYMFDERRGFMALANINPDKLDVVSEFRVTDGTGAYFSHPSIYNGVLYVRHGQTLSAYLVK